MGENELLHNMSYQVLDVFIFVFTVCHSAGLEEIDIVKQLTRDLGLSANSVTLVDTCSW